jgi:hypothetical protein
VEVLAVLIYFLLKEAENLTLNIQADINQIYALAGALI